MAFVLRSLHRNYQILPEYSEVLRIMIWIWIIMLLLRLRMGTLGFFGGETPTEGFKLVSSSGIQTIYIEDEGLTVGRTFLCHVIVLNLLKSLKIWLYLEGKRSEIRYLTAPWEVWDLHSTPLQVNRKTFCSYFWMVWSKKTGKNIH